MEPNEHVLEENPLLATVVAEEPQPDVTLNTLLPEQMQVAMESIQTLRDLQYTISEEGVSSHDVLAVQQVCDRLQQAGLGVRTVPALESMPVLFTPNRSSLNHTVSMEGIGETIIRVIKEWIRKLVDFVINAIRWVKAKMMATDVIRAKVHALDSAVLNLYSRYENMLDLNRRSSRDLSEKYNAALKQVLTHTQLPKSKAMLAAFGNNEHTKEIANYHSLVSQWILDTELSVRKLNRYIQGVDTELPELTGLNASAGRSLVENIGTFFEEQPDPEWLYSVVNKEFMVNATKLPRREIYPFQAWYLSFTRCADELKKIRKVENIDANEQAKIQAVVNHITEAVNQIMPILEKFSEFYKLQYKASVTYVNYYSLALDITRTDFLMNAPSDLIREQWDALVKKFTQAFKEAGL